MTEETGENSPKDEDNTTNMDTSKCAKLFFYRYLFIAFPMADTDEDWKSKLPQQHSLHYRQLS